MAAIIGGSALAIYGLSRRSRGGAAMAAVGGVFAINNLRQQSAGNTQPVHTSFAINCTPEQAYRMWRNFENLPRFMRHLESVKVNGNESEWTALGPGDARFHWKAEITDDIQNQRISWRSLPGSQIENRGSVEFREGTAGRGTVVTVKMAYLPPTGPLGRAVASLTGKHPDFTVREDVRRFKALLETGETPTTIGQTHGPRGIHGNVERQLFREPQNMPEPQEYRELRKTA
jgi:uncharacterized membrane protein